MQKKILIIAGEPSGDLHAGNLISNLKKSLPDVYVFGIGGKNLKNAGVDIITDLTDFACVGFFEVLKNYKKFKKAFDNIILKAKELKPEAAILVDYPGFNLRLAKELKKLNIKIIYFISPQVWAWGAKRIKFIKSHVDLMLVLFKFEKILYNEKTFNVKFVGHPLLDIVKPETERNILIKNIGFNESCPIISLLPGSREQEVSSLLPTMLAAAAKIHKRIPNVQFIICCSSSVKRELYKKIIDKTKIDFTYKTLNDMTYSGVNASELAVVASGTATLETAILNKPMVIVYKVNLLTWLLAKMFVKIPNIGLVNIIAGEKIVPELVQFDVTPEKIANAALSIMGNVIVKQKIQTELFALKNTLGIPGACRRASEEIEKFLK